MRSLCLSVAAVLVALLALLVGARSATADLYLEPVRQIQLTHIDGEQAVLRPRAADIDGDGLPDLVIADASCEQFPCPTNRAYSLVYPILGRRRRRVAVSRPDPPGRVLGHRGRRRRRCEP
jgi:hypothetical protein